MSHHLVAASESVDQTLDNLTWVTTLEQQVQISGDDLTVGDKLRNVVGVLFGAPTIDSARLVASSLVAQYREGGPDFSPLNVGAEIISPTPFHDFRRFPIQLERGDVLNAKIANSGAGSAEDAYALVWLANGPIQPARDFPWRSFKFTTSASAVTAEAWTSRSLTASQRLTPGRYACGGAYAVTTSGRAMRLSFQGQAFKPGVLIADAESDVIAPEIFRNGGMGILGEFDHDTLPAVEFFCDAADNEVQEVYLDLIKVA